MNLSSRIPMSAEVVDRIQESPSIFSLRLRLVDLEQRQRYRFKPGQFNMLYLFGVGEVPISIVSDPLGETLIDHTIRAVGRVTDGLSALQPGAQIGLRGPFGNGWPLSKAQGRDLVIVTGGLGCAPVVAVINYVLMRREQFGRLTIIQGVKHADDLIWRQRYDYWKQLPNTSVLIAADEGGPLWPFHRGRVTDLFDQVELDPARSIGFLCGPEPMLKVASEALCDHGIAPFDLYLSMERNMQCALGHCGHCQYGADFLCKDGPVLSYRHLRDRLGKRGV